MKNKIILLLSLIMIIGLSYYYFSSAYSSKSHEKQKQEDLIKNIEIEDQLAELFFSRHENFEIKKIGEDFIDLNTSVKSIGVDKFTGEKITDYYTPIKFYFLNDQNPTKQPINNWFEENNPDQQKQSPYSVISQEDIVIDGIEALRVEYAASVMLTGGYYNLVVIYIPYEGDIYQIEGYALPEEPDPLFTQEDIQASKEYEEIFGSIIKSIRFVKKE